MSLDTYRFLHMCGLIIFFFSMGGLILGTWLTNNRIFNHKRVFALLHGMGLVLIIVSGFGQLARLQGSGAGLPGWVIGKVLIWLVLGGLMAPILRKPHLNPIFWKVTILLGIVASYFGVFKPF